ncbi:hypothetical protein [Brassicibacter mesophilus]|uniref:hypothetical protein n=1 Tax=Brassicibacter mesophilus TaxID=745119 RepID=UPI003D1E2D7A
MSIVYRIYNANQVRQLEEEAYRVLSEMTGGSSSTAKPLIDGAGDYIIGQGIGYIAKEAGEKILDPLSAYLSCIDNMSLSLVSQTHKLWREARILLTDKDFNYDLAKFELNEVTRYIPPKKGWPGGYLKTQDDTPTIYAVHTPNGWKLA